MGRDHRIPGGYRLNWTNVGLKSGFLLGVVTTALGLNWTNVGLKSPGDPLVGAEGPGLNWTNVGLK